MSVQRGDVVLAWFPFASGAGGKRRPCLVIQNDPDNQKLGNTVIAQITGNLARVGAKSHLLIDEPIAALRFSPDGRLLAAVCECGPVLLWEVGTPPGK